VVGGLKGIRMENYNCPNKSQHVSAFPAFDRELCPVCRKTYVLKKEATKEAKDDN